MIAGADEFPLPLRMEVEAARRIIDALRPRTKACLDVGFANPQACLRLRDAGGYWTSVATKSDAQTRLHDALTEDVAMLGADGQLPFEDKQFDIVVLALGSLSGNAATDTALVRECHRVLKAPGYLILSVEYDKPFGLAWLLSGRRAVAGAGGRYSEAELFDLLKTGFDWLGMRHSCRFWVQLVRQRVNRHLPQDEGKPIAMLYAAARQLDRLTFWTRGYLVTAYGRRKGWRPRQTPLLADGRSMPDAVLRKL